MYREPAPTLLLAAYISAVQFVQGVVPFEQFVEGPGARLLKWSNLIWASAFSFAIYKAVVLLTASRILAAAATILSNVALSHYMNGLMSEYAAAALLAASSYFLLAAIYRERAVYFVASGVCFGALILTKASYLYTVIVMVAFLVWPAALPRAVRFKGVLLYGAAIARDDSTVDGEKLHSFWHLSDHRAGRRGPHDPSPEEPDELGRVSRGVLCLGAGLPASGNAQYLGFKDDDAIPTGALRRLTRHTTASEADKEAERDGRPQDAVSFYHAARAERTKFEAELRAQGHRWPSVQADALMKSRAIEIILAHPMKHVIATLPFLWRGGGWSFPVLLFDLFCSLSTAHGSQRYLLPALTVLLFYAFASHNLPRLGDSVIPVAIVCVAVLIQIGAKRMASVHSRWRAGRIAQEREPFLG